MKPKLILIFALISAVFSSSAFAANVTCNFYSETHISKTGEWLKDDQDIMKLMEMFGDGLVLKIDNALLAKLDSQQPFLAGEVSRGAVYLMGGDVGITGKLISVEEELITLYDGMCQVSFG